MIILITYCETEFADSVEWSLKYCKINSDQNILIIFNSSNAMPDNVNTNSTVKTLHYPSNRKIDCYLLLINIKY